MRAAGPKWSGLVALREFNKTVTEHPRVARCGGKIRRGVVGAADEILAMSIYCNHVWLCPICATRHAYRWRQWLQQHLAAWASTGGNMAMLTLTVAHSRDDPLDGLMQRLDAGWSSLQRGSGWRSDRHRFGIQHFMRVTEVVHNVDSGWQPHFHALLLCDPASASCRWDELHDRMAARFLHGVRAAGGSAELAGQDLKLLDPAAGQRTAVYCTKGALPSRSGGSRTPAAILADLMSTGEGIDLAKEFDTTFTLAKHRRYSPSRQLGQLLSKA